MRTTPTVLTSGMAVAATPNLIDQAITEVQAGIEND
jgi:hypothetical protein